jgi:hypothetical protein
MPNETVRGSQLFIKVGDGASPEVFAHPCLINTQRGIQFQSQANKTIVPDCDNPDDPAWTLVTKDQLGATINGSGTLNVADVEDYDAWFRSADPKNVEVWLGTKGHWAGSFHCTNFNVTGDRGSFAQVTITLESEGVVAAFVAAT